MTIRCAIENAISFGIDVALPKDKLTFDERLKLLVEIRNRIDELAEANQW